MPTLINLRGTGGSGKSTVVARVMRHYTTRTPVMVEGPRRQPLAYDLTAEGHPPLYVPGHYEIACGGCDTLKTISEVYRLVKSAYEAGKDVLWEGIMFQDSADKDLIPFLKSHKVLVITLNTSLEDCLAAVRARRESSGNIRPLDPKNTISRYHSVNRKTNRLIDAGVEVRKLNREEAYQEALRRLGWTLGGVVESADTPALEAGSATSEGSSPSAPTK